MANDFQRVAVIMAGGSGERFWPLSRKNRPKQLLKLASPDRTMIQQAVDRIVPLFSAEKIFVVTGEHLVDPIRKANLGIPAENILAEPAKRNTGGALVYAAAALLARFGSDARLSMAVFAADHRIAPDNIYRDDLALALETVEKNGGLAVIGIPPDRPATGYGYIEVGAPSPKGAERVKAFKEKPDLTTATRYASSGHHFWNSGMFFWRVDEFRRELAAAAPALEAAIPELAELIRQDAAAKSGHAKTLPRFEKLDNISIDYALMEKAKNVWMIPARFQWDDLGTWESLRRSTPADANGNIVTGNPVIIDTRNSIVVNDAGSDRMAVAVVGLDNIVVAVTEDGIVVLPANRTEDVSKAVAELKKRNAKQL